MDAPHVASSRYPASSEVREGLLLCMFLCSSLDVADGSTDIAREIAVIASQEREFTGKPEEFQRVLELVSKDLHRDPDDLLGTIRRLLPRDDDRRRGLELAVRIITSDGIVTPDQRALLRQLAKGLELGQDALEDAVIAAQERLARFMMLYLAYLTALSDGQLHVEEFEALIPFVLKLPVFHGVTTDEFAFMSRAVRQRVERMRTEKGIDYLTATLRNASEILGQPDIPKQALALVAHGIFADGKVDDAEAKFYSSVARKLSFSEEEAEELAQMARK